MWKQVMPNAAGMLALLALLAKKSGTSYFAANGTNIAKGAALVPLAQNIGHRFLVGGGFYSHFP